MTGSTLQGIGYTCFGLSYLFAFLLEVARLVWPRAGWRPAALTWGIVGFLLHSLYIGINWPISPAAPSGSLLWLALVFAFFYLYGTINHAKQAWAVFVLPLVLGLVALSFVMLGAAGVNPNFDFPTWASGERFWGIIHGTLILLAAVGVSVGFLASVMYLIQARRLRKKVNPGRVVPLLSLEKLENMNRKALNLAFPLLTAGVLVGTLLLGHGRDIGDNWLSLKIVSTGGLWLVFLVLLYLRYGAHVPPRRLALLSIFAFVLMIVALVASHPFAVGGGS